MSGVSSSLAALRAVRLGLGAVAASVALRVAVVAVALAGEAEGGVQLLVLHVVQRDLVEDLVADLIARRHRVALDDDVDEVAELWRHLGQKQNREDRVGDGDGVGQRVVGGDLFFDAGYDVVAERLLEDAKERLDRGRRRGWA